MSAGEVDAAGKEPETAHNLCLSLINLVLKFIASLPRSSPYGNLSSVYDWEGHQRLLWP